MMQADSVQVVTRITAAHHNFSPELIFVDDTGPWAKGAIDICNAAGLPIVSVVYSAKAPDPRFKNMRAYMWMKGAQANTLQGRESPRVSRSADL